MYICITQPDLKMQYALAYKVFTEVGLVYNTSNSGGRLWNTNLTTRGTFYYYQDGLTLIPVCINNLTSSEVWDEITYPLPNFNGCTIEVWE